MNPLQFFTTVILIWSIVGINRNAMKLTMIMFVYSIMWRYLDILEKGGEQSGWFY